MLRVLTGVALISLISLEANAEEHPALTIWKAQKCDSCHGAAGQAETKVGQAKKITDMTTAAFQKKWTDEQMRTSIVKGIDRAADGKQEKMKAFDKLKPEEVDALIALIRSWAPKS